jgi:alkyl sulfatase BDS1-like metallo-beta-lactamase superfamily hydrolase
VDEAAFARRSQPGTDERPLEASMAIETPAPATREIVEANAAVRMRLPFADTEDFDDARRGRIGSLSDPVIRATDGRVLWDADAYAFLDAECPDTVNPSLWRRASWRPSMASSR